MNQYDFSKDAEATSIRFNTRILIFILSILSPGAFAARPTTIPALREWTDGTGSFTLTSSSRIIINTASGNRLASTSAVFAEDIRQLTGFTLPVVSATNATAGDIFLSLGSTDTMLGKEGYSMSITNQLDIKANTDTGAFYGTRTILQLLAQKLTIAGGTARDWPDYPERSFMIDNGRKYISVEWLAAHIKDMSYLKLNVFQLHLADNQGFRLKSSVHPEISSAQCYTRSEMDSIQALAKQYKVTIVPEIDMPGHMDAMLSKHPELKNADGYFDLTNSASYAFVKSVLNEFIPWFQSPYWHTGADEFEGINDPKMLTYARAKYGNRAVSRDVYIDFVNMIDSIAKAKGKILRSWSDVSEKGVAVKLNTDITMDVWYTFGLAAQQLIDEGHLIINSSFDRLYYVIGHVMHPNDKTLYEEFKPHMFVGNQNIIPKNIKNLGSKLHVWCDNPGEETETQLAQNIYYTLRNQAQASWGSPLLVPAFKDFAPIVGKIGSSPGLTKKIFDIPTHADIALYKPVTASSLDPHLPGFREPSTEIYHATDGDVITRWKSASSGLQWMIIDLLGDYEIDRIKLTWEKGYGNVYRLDVSNDGSNWRTIFSTTNGDGGIDDDQFPAQHARYVKLYGNSSGGYSLWECEVYGSISSGIYDPQEITEQMHILETNASNGELTVSFDLDTKNNAVLEIYTSLGEKVYSTNFENTSNRTETLSMGKAMATGIYLCVLTTGDKRISRKFLMK